MLSGFELVHDGSYHADIFDHRGRACAAHKNYRVMKTSVAVAFGATMFSSSCLNNLYVTYFMEMVGQTNAFLLSGNQKKTQL